MKQILSQHIQEQKEGGSRKKAGFFSSLFFLLAMSCASLDNLRWDCCPGFCGLYYWSMTYESTFSTDFIHTSDIRDLLQEFNQPDTAHSRKNYGWDNYSYFINRHLQFDPSPKKEKKQKNHFPFNWYPDTSGLKEEEIVLDKFHPLRVA